MEQQLTAGLGEGQIEFIEYNKVPPGEIFGKPSLAAAARLGLKMSGGLGVGIPYLEDALGPICVQRWVFGKAAIQRCSQGTAWEGIMADRSRPPRRALFHFVIATLALMAAAHAQADATSTLPGETQPIEIKIVSTEFKYTLMQVEGGHRVVGRVLFDAEPWDNWAFGPVAPLKSFLQVPDAVKAAGFLSPRPGNDFTFHPVSAKFPGVINTAP
jgi:hypothetical protein